MEFDDDGIAYYVEDGKLKFTEEGLRYYTEKERNRLIELNVQLGINFNEICNYLANKLGYGSKETLSAELKARILEEAEEVTQQAEVELSDVEPSLHALLVAHNELCDAIFAILEAALDRRAKVGQL
jgi:hypothetical protein